MGAPFPLSRVLKRGGPVLLRMVLLAAPLTLAQADVPGPPRRLSLCGYQRTFTEDFDHLSVSARGERDSRWIAHTPWDGDFGDAVFADPSPDFPFSIRNGVLTIEARRQQDGKWASGLLASSGARRGGFSQTYGYFEIRAKLPVGPGVWPAFWLSTDTRAGHGEPTVEVDVFEHYGQFPGDFHSVIHVWNGANPALNRVEDHVTHVQAGSVSSEFHTYGVDVEPEWTIYYFDRAEIWRVRTPAEHKRPLLILVDLALGGGWPIDKTPSPSLMQIAYIRAFAPRPDFANQCRTREQGSTR